MIGPHDIGRRVVVRRIVEVRDDRPVFSDILGHLLAATETHFTVRTRTGEVEVPKSEIALAKTVPDKRRLTPTEALELAAAAGWPPKEQAALGDWVLRATDGWTIRGNSVLPVGDPDRPVREAISAVEDWYRSRGLRPAISVPVPLFRRLDEELDRRGWTAMPLTLVMTAPVASLRIPTGGVALDPTPSEVWMSAVAGRKGQFPASAWSVLTAVPKVRFGSLYDQSGALLATGRGCVADPAGRWLGLSLIGVQEHARRQGLARRMIGALVEWGRSVRARDVYLQVEQRNEAAVTLYTELGLTVHHAYSSRVLDTVLSA